MRSPKIENGACVRCIIISLGGFNIIADQVAFKVGNWLYCHFTNNIYRRNSLDENALSTGPRIESLRDADDRRLAPLKSLSFK